MQISRINKTKFLVQAAVVAALYTVLTVSLAPLSFGGQQFRVAEALAVLPAITPAAIPGLFIGCILSNTFSFMGVADMIFGSLATLIAAAATYYAAKAVGNGSIFLRLALIPMPPVVINTFIIGAMLKLIAGIPFPVAAFGVFVGQMCACYIVGCPLYLAIYNLQKNKSINLILKVKD